MNPKLPIALFLVAGVIAGAALLRPGAGAGDTSVALPDPVAMRAAGYGYDPLDEVVDVWRDRVVADPTDNLSRVQLGASLLGLARETGDLDLYPEAEAELRRAVLAAPTDVGAVTTLAGALSAQHEFAEARALLADVARVRPDDVSLRYALVDVNLDLGRYDRARSLLDELAETHPDDVATLSRQARVAALTGDPAAAVDHAAAMLRQAASVGLRPAEAAGLWFQVAFFQYQGGELEAAESTLRSALLIEPEHGPSLELLGRVLVARGDLDEAAAVYEGLLADGPIPDLNGLLAEVYRAQGREAAADEQERIGLAAAREQIGAYPAERRHLAGFFADLEPATFLRLMEEDIATRADVGGLDLLAWAQYLNGDVEEARATMARARSLGTVDAPLLFHAGMIEAATGDDDEARDLLEQALDLNPGFDLSDVALARETLASL